MRDYDPAEVGHLLAREGVRPRTLVWIEARTRDGGLPAPAGFWSGEDDATFTVGGVPRSYFGAGGLLGMEDLAIEKGVRVRTIEVWLSSAAPEVVNAVMGYDLRLARVEVHRVLTHPLTHEPVAAPHRIWKGRVDGAPRVVPKKGLNPGRITLQLASAAIALTRPLPLKYSDDTMRLRGDGDRLFRYVDVSGKVPVWWGEKRYDAPAAAAPATPFPVVFRESER